MHMPTITSCLIPAHFIFKDLSEYKYDMMVSKSLDILNKLYSSQSDMFKLSMEAQVNFNNFDAIENLCKKMWAMTLNFGTYCILAKNRLIQVLQAHQNLHC